MFERYTERARRVLFFARYEASQLGSISIETEHLLLGLIREEKGLTSRIFARSNLSLENMRKDIEERTVFREKVSTAVEIPFSAETKRALQCAAEEADRLLHNHIGTEHLLLGLLREESSLASDVLRKNGFELATVRSQIVELRRTTSEDDRSPARLVQEIDHLKGLVERLAQMVPDQPSARSLLEQITSELDRVRERFGPYFP